MSRIVFDRLGLSKIRLNLRLAGRVQGLLLLANAPSVRLGHTRLDQVVHYCNVLRACNCVHVQFTLSIPPMFLCSLPLMMLLLFRGPFCTLRCVIHLLSADIHRLCAISSIAFLLDQRLPDQGEMGQ